VILKQKSTTSKKYIFLYHIYISNRNLSKQSEKAQVFISEEEFSVDKIQIPAKDADLTNNYLNSLSPAGS
jgi:hypothetical protein